MDDHSTLASALGHALKQRGYLLTLAESCTGGMAAQAITSIAGSITGIAGPSGGSTEKPVGTVCFALVGNHLPMFTCTQQFTGDRTAIRQQATAFMLATLTEQLNLLNRLS